MSKNLELLRQAGKEPHLPQAESAHILAPASAPRLLRESPGVPARDLFADWQRIWRTLHKHWRVSCIFAAAVMVTVLATTLMMRPVYEPVARLEIDPPGAELFSLDGRSGGGSDTEYIETQARNLQSAELAITVMRQMHLEQNPEFVTRRGFISRAIAAIKPGQGAASQMEMGSVPGAPQPLVLTAEEAATLQGFQEQLKVRRDTASRLITVSFSSHEPALSAAITNAVIATFIDRTYQARHAAIMQSTEWLSRQLVDIRAKTDESNQALAEFQRTSGIADLERDRSTVSEEMTELSRQRTQATGERMQLESFLQKVRKQTPESLPQVQTSPVIQQLTQKLAEAHAELSQVSAVYGANHPNVKKLRNQIDELQGQIRLQRDLIVAQMEISHAAALSRERLVDAEMKGATRKLGLVAEYTTLKKQAQANSDLYNALYARVKEAGIAAASKSSNIRIVDQARVLDSPTRPKPFMNFGFGVLAAVVGGVLIAFAREAFDTRIHDIDDVRQCTGISSVAVLPLAMPNGNVAGLFHMYRSSVWPDKPVKFLLQDPASAQSEALRSLHTAVLLSGNHQAPQVVLVASSLPGEGKTTVALNLATALAQQGRTCLLDADLRRPAIGAAFNLSHAAGLREHLSDSAPLETITFAAEEIPNLKVIPAGRAARDCESLINLDRMRHLILSLRSQYDFIVIDSPPVLPYAEGRAISAFVDGVVFVGRANLVTREALARSMELLEEVHSAPIIELVLNGADPRVQSYGYSYRSYYGTA
jgi:succinoglycan biosynthesis transport protein ExoP